MFQRVQLIQNSQRHFLYISGYSLGIKKMRSPLPPHVKEESFDPSLERHISCAGRHMNYPAERGCFSRGWVGAGPPTDAVFTLAVLRHSQVEKGLNMLVYKKKSLNKI
jgi:hypothetical protein